MGLDTIKDIIAIGIVVFIAIKLWKFMNISYFVKNGKRYQKDA